METRRLSPPPSRQRAFTLVELLVAMGVIAVLVGITFGAVSGAWNSSNKSAAASQIQALSTAIESYKVDNGAYPVATALIATSGEEPSANPSGYSASGQLLYQAVTGSTKWGVAPTSTNYFPNLKKGMIQETSSASYFIDPWGFAYGYRSLDAFTDHDNDASTPRQQLSSGGYNLGFFDLWSTGGATTANSPKWIVNWVPTGTDASDPKAQRYRAQ